MRGANRVVVAGQVQVEVLHWDHLAVASSGSAALDPEHWPEGWLPDGYGGPPADSTESLGKPDGRRRLALAERRRRDGRHDNVLTEWVLRLEPANRLPVKRACLCRIVRDEAWPQPDHGDMTDIETRPHA